jgi:hypothetical protein
LLFGSFIHSSLGLVKEILSQYTKQQEMFFTVISGVTASVV